MSKIKLPFQPVREELTLTTMRNNFLHAFHQKHIFDDWQIRTLSSHKKIDDPVFSATFIFDGKHELTFASAQLPFLELLEQWSAPWHWNELSPTLAHALLEEVLAHFQTALPPQLCLSNFSANPLVEQNKDACLMCELAKENTLYHLTIYTQPDFPFAQLAQALKVTQQTPPLYPPHLSIELPIKFGSTQLPVSALKTLEQGDIILMHPPSLEGDTP